MDSKDDWNFPRKVQTSSYQAARRMRDSKSMPVKNTHRSHLNLAAMHCAKNSPKINSQLSLNPQLRPSASASSPARKTRRRARATASFQQGRGQTRTVLAQVLMQSIPSETSQPSRSASICRNKRRRNIKHGGIRQLIEDCPLS